MLHHKSRWLVGAQVFRGNPYDGHALAETLEQVTKLVTSPELVFVDRGYRVHGYNGTIEMHDYKHHRGRTPISLWWRIKRRAAVEPSIGHLKQEHRMGKNWLRGIEGGRFNVILSVAGMNFRKLMKFI